MNDAYSRKIRPLAEHNNWQSSVAAARDVLIAKALLTSGRRLTARQERIVRARYSRPLLSWREIGELLGEPKNSVAAIFRRLAIAGEHRPPPLPRAALTADPDILCQADVEPDMIPAPGEGNGCNLCVQVAGTSRRICTEECDTHQCTEVSRFVVGRVDQDPSYGINGYHEACETHLAGVVVAMAGGDNRVRLVVRPRWDP